MLITHVKIMFKRKHEKVWPGGIPVIYLSYQVRDKRQAWEARRRNVEACKSGNKPHPTFHRPVPRNRSWQVSFERGTWEIKPGNRFFGTSSTHKGRVRKNQVFVGPLKSQGFVSQNLRKWSFTKLRCRRVIPERVDLKRKSHNNSSLALFETYGF